MFLVNAKGREDLHRPPTMAGGRGLWGHLDRMVDAPLELFMEAQREYGDVVRVRLGHRWAYLLFHPDDVHRVMVGNIDNYAKQTREYQQLRLFLGEGLVTSEGDFWRRQRRIAQPAFHKKRLEGFVESMHQATEATGERWARLAASGQPVDVAEEMMSLALEIAGKTLFSRHLKNRESDVIASSLAVVMDHYMKLLWSRVPYPECWPTRSNKRFRGAVGAMREQVHEMIRERRLDGRDRGDLLSMFMLAEDEETGERMSDVQLIDESLTMLLAGHETTANVLAWSFYLLALHPEALAQVEAEIAGVYGGGEEPSFANLRALTYTEQVLKESMRLYPPLWALARLVLEDDQLGGYDIPGDSFVFVSPYAIHRHPSFWESPDRFDPARFSPQQQEARRALGLSRFSYLPFSAGQRKCIGEHFAMMEAKLILATLLRRFKISLVPGHPVEPEPSITLRPRYGVKMHLTAR